MRVPSPPEALLALLGFGAAALAARAIIRAAPDLWVLINALAQPSR